MKLIEIQMLFRYEAERNDNGSFNGCNGNTGNTDFGEILSLAAGHLAGNVPIGALHELENGQEVELVQVVNNRSDWSGEAYTAVFKIEDTFFEITGNADSWDGVPDYTYPSVIVLVRPTAKVITVYERL